MSNITLFEGKKFKLPAMPSGFEDSITKTIAGGGSGSAGNRRISIKGKAFRQVVNGEEIYVSEDRTLDVILVNAAPVSRQYYEGAYDPKATAIPPTCWSSNTQAPDPSVPADQRRSGSASTNRKKSRMKNASKLCSMSSSRGWGISLLQIKATSRAAIHRGWSGCLCRLALKEGGWNAPLDTRQRRSRFAWACGSRTGAPCRERV